MEQQNSQDGPRFQRQEHSRQGREYGLVRKVQEHEQHDHERVGHSREHVQKAGQQVEFRSAQHQHQVQQHVNDIAIFIDRKAYHIKDPRITAADLRKIPVPPIADDKEIFHVVAGVGNIKMSDADVIEINMHEKDHGRHFLSAPKSSRHDEVARKAYAIYLQRGCKHGYDLADWIEAEEQTDK